MITLVLRLLRLLPFLIGRHRQIALENLALHQQLAVYKRTAPRPKLRTTDRLFWAGLARVWTGWRQALVIVSPETILRCDGRGHGKPPDSGGCGLGTRGVKLAVPHEQPAVSSPGGQD